MTPPQAKSFFFLASAGNPFFKAYKPNIFKERTSRQHIIKLNKFLIIRWSLSEKRDEGPNEEVGSRGIGRANLDGQWATHALSRLQINPYPAERVLWAIKSASIKFQFYVQSPNAV